MQTDCPTCARADVTRSGAELPHVHCDRCAGAILPGMAHCVWCGKPCAELAELAELRAELPELRASLLASRADAEMWRANYFSTLETLAAERAEQESGQR